MLVPTGEGSSGQDPFGSGYMGACLLQFVKLCICLLWVCLIYNSNAFFFNDSECLLYLYSFLANEESRCPVMLGTSPRMDSSRTSQGSSKLCISQDFITAGKPRMGSKGYETSATTGSWQKAQAPGFVGAVGQKKERWGEGKEDRMRAGRMGLPFSCNIKPEKPSLSIKEWI